MPVDDAKLSAVLSSLREGGVGAEAVYERYLDALPSTFGSTKLAYEADLVLAALCEVAHADAVAAQAPVSVRCVGKYEDSEFLFEALQSAPFEAADPNWTGGPLLALATALSRAREPNPKFPRVQKTLAYPLLKNAAQSAHFSDMHRLYRNQLFVVRTAGSVAATATSRWRRSARKY